MPDDKATNSTAAVTPDGEDDALPFGVTMILVEPRNYVAAEGNSRMSALRQLLENRAAGQDDQP